MSIFPYMDGIDFSSYEGFVDRVEEMRNNMLVPDKEFIMAEPIELDPKKTKEIPTGRFFTIFQGIRLECLAFIKKESPLYIMFSGDVGDTGRSEPLFNRWSYYKYCGGSVLCIADPMIGIYNHLRMGWYYGNSTMNFRKLIAEFVKLVADILSVSNEDIIFFGSSAGGAPVFECAAYIPQAKAVAINPQIVLKEYSYAEEFIRITGNDLDGDLSDSRNNALHYIKSHARNSYIIIDNIRSETDMQQMKNIKESLGINIQYGLNVYDNLVIWLYDADVSPMFNPHSACENYCVWFFIEYIISNINNREVLNDLKPLYRLINEFWYTHWSLRKTQREHVKLWGQTLNMIYGSGKKAAVFGCGKRGKEICNNLLDVQGQNYFHVSFAIDNDRKKAGKNIMGLTVKHPAEIMDWHELYIVITTDLYSDEICKQLENLGLIYEQEFIRYTDLEL